MFTFGSPFPTTSNDALAVVVVNDGEGGPQTHEPVCPEVYDKVPIILSKEVPIAKKASTPDGLPDIADKTSGIITTQIYHVLRVISAAETQQQAPALVGGVLALTTGPVQYALLVIARLQRCGKAKRPEKTMGFKLIGALEIVESHAIEEWMIRHVDDINKLMIAMSYRYVGLFSLLWIFYF